MTKKEFLEYVDSFDRDTGEFTEEELYAIGTQYKELPVSEKNWEELVKILGVNKTGENFRTWIKSRQYADGTIKKNIQLLSGQTVEDLSFPEAEEKIEEIKRDLYKQQVKTRDTWNAYRRDVRKDAREENFYDMFAEAVKTYPALPQYKTLPVISTDNEAVMLLSDIHLGMEINNFFNHYNLEIAKKRFDTYIDEVIKMCQLHQVRRLNICNLGDCIHGIINVTGRIEAEMNVIDQVMQVAEMLAQGLNKLQNAASEVIYRSVTDNHSRAMANFKENMESENLSRLIDFYLKPRLKDTSIIFAEDNLDYDISFFELLNGQKVICSHGHRDNINVAVQGYLGATKQFVDYICLGHFHESKMKSFQGAKVIVNGSVCGSDSYAQSKRLYGDPEQTLIIIDNNSVIIDNVKLNIQ